MVDSANELSELKSKLSGCLGTKTLPSKRPYVRKPKSEPSLLEKAGVNAASESLQEQAQQPAKRTRAKKETAEEIKGNIGALNDAVIDL